MIKQPNRLDWMVYRFFKAWWSPVLKNNPAFKFALAVALISWLGAVVGYDQDMDELTVTFYDKND